MSKITLEDGAQIVVESIDCLLLNDANYEDEAETLHQIAALIRAAQKVVEAADEVWLPGAGYRECGCELKGKDDLDSALAAFRKLEEGE